MTMCGYVHVNARAREVSDPPELESQAVVTIWPEENPGLLQEQPVLLAAEPRLQPLSKSPNLLCVSVNYTGGASHMMGARLLPSSAKDHRGIK